MPELPEVETIRRGLAPHVPGRTVTGVELYSPKQFLGDPDQLVGQVVQAVERQGKLLIFPLASNHYLTIHLKMTGQLLWMRGQESVTGGHPEMAYLEGLPNRHTRLSFTFDDGAVLYFNDLRRFGQAALLSKSEYDQLTFLKELGPEPLSSQFSVAYVSERLQKRPNTPIKSFLLDQTNLAGLGNIYADESLFRAGILPTRLSGSLQANEVEALHTAIGEVLRLAISHGGSSARDYLDAAGKRGTYLDVAQVYRRTGEPCWRCGTPIARIVVGGRSTHFCPVCQH